MTEPVLSNRDLVRTILKQSTSATPLLAASKSIRQSEECTPYFERWARNGCPANPTESQEKRCLDEMGGVEGEFCQGSFLVSRDGHPDKMVRPRTLARAVSRRMVGPDRTLVFTFGTTILRIHHSADDGNTVTLTLDGWRRKGSRCRPNDGQVSHLIRALLTTRGLVALPCNGTNSQGSVQVPHRASVRLLGGERLEATRR